MCPSTFRGTAPTPRKRKAPCGQERPPPQTDSEGRGGGRGYETATRLRPKLSNLPFLTYLPLPPEPPRPALPDQTQDGQLNLNYR